MPNTFENLPKNIEEAISTILSQQPNNKWTKRAVSLHDKYMNNQLDGSQQFIQDIEDALAYLAMRTPATYAQVCGALSAAKEMLPKWTPKTVLDIGSGPGVGVWASATVWPTIEEAACIDSNQHVLSFGQQIAGLAQLPIDITWIQQNIQNRISTGKKYDIVIIANVLNELNEKDREKLIHSAHTLCTGVFIIVEPGTPSGSKIAEESARLFENTNSLLAPYIGNSFVQKGGFWMHFSQKFQRPQFQRRIRQHMRENPLMASDIEDAKYSFVVISKTNTPKNVWARCIGHIKKQKGFIEVPIITNEKIMTIKILQRYKKEYNFAKELKWGSVIEKEEDIAANSD